MTVENPLLINQLNRLSGTPAVLTPILSTVPVRITSTHPTKPRGKLRSVFGSFRIAHRAVCRAVYAGNTSIADCEINIEKDGSQAQ